jgi:hypothetical protein
MRIIIIRRRVTLRRIRTQTYIFISHIYNNHTLVSDAVSGPRFFNFIIKNNFKYKANNKKKNIKRDTSQNILSY